MGGCLFSMLDNIPDVPPVIKPDPPMNQPILAVTASLGSFGWSHDYGVWENQRPDDSQQQKDSIWLWFRKREETTLFRIQLENFVRNDPNNPSLGQVLCFALKQMTPTIQSFQRIAGQSTDFFSGFLPGYQPFDDGYYVNHPDHIGQFQTGVEEVSRTILITKWQSYSTTTVCDGNVGRATDSLKNQPILLDVLAIGTTVSTYQVTRKYVQDFDANGQPVGGHYDNQVNRYDNTFVENVQYRITVNGLLWAEWNVAGDAAYAAGNDVLVSTPFFQTRIEGGWFSRSKFHVQTSNGIDPALALLFSHIVTTEYSIPDVKNNLNLPIPVNPPEPFSLFPPSMPLSFPLSPTNGNFIVKF